jgi:PhzF family phenazine biosynthesis protein
MTRLAIPYWHVDAFADRPFAGNQAAVMPLEEWLPDETLQAIAEENLFAETAFVVRDETGATDWELRWFTPAIEVALCGHATLASGHVLLTRDGGEKVSFRTRKSGVLEVRRAGEAYELALPAIPTDPGAPDGVAEMLGAPSDFAPLEACSNAKGYGLFLYPDETSVRALRPDFKALAAFGDFMVICTAPGERTDVVSRVFVPGAGIDEDSVTGSAHAVLAPFWAARLGRASFTAHQASARGGDLTCRLDGDQAWLGGQCVTVVEGAFYVSG